MMTSRCTPRPLNAKSSPPADNLSVAIRLTPMVVETTKFNTEPLHTGAGRDFSYKLSAGGEDFALSGLGVQREVIITVR